MTLPISVSESNARQSDRAVRLLACSDRTLGLTLIIFGLALAVRWLILAYTDGMVDDAFITMRVARNIATGEGFVYNPGQRVQAVSSPLWALISSGLWWFLGEHTLIAVRIFGGLADAATASCVAMLAGRSMNNLVYESTSSYVAAAFAGALYAGMSTTALMATNGLETGMYTSTIAATFLALTYHRHSLAAALAGVAVLLHPDGALLAVIVWCVVSVRCRCLPWKEILITTMVVAPYAVFAIAYYGTVVPQTVVAKSFINHAAIEQWTFFCRKFFFSRPEAWLLGVTCLIGVGVAFRRRSDLIPIFVWGGAYVAAFSSFAMWWPWYLPPAMIAYSIASGVGLATVVLWAVTWLGKPHQERAIGLYAAAGLLVLLLVQTAKYASHGHEAKELYMNQRRNIANWINSHTSPAATVMMEPFGMVGYFSNRRFYDYPGLASPQVTDALAELGTKIPGKPIDPFIVGHLLGRVRPLLVVLREDEFRVNLAGGALVDYELSSVFKIGPEYTARYGDLQTMYVLSLRDKSEDVQQFGGG